MALLVFTDKTRQKIDAELGHEIWKVLNGSVKPTKDQEKFCEKVERVYLNWRNAPDDYLIKHKEILRDMVLLWWMRDRQGNVTRPEPNDNDCIRASRVLGLLEHGKPTDLVVEHNRARNVKHWIKQ